MTEAASVIAKAMLVMVVAAAAAVAGRRWAFTAPHFAVVLIWVLGRLTRQLHTSLWF